MGWVRSKLKKIPGLQWFYRSYIETPGSWIFRPQNMVWLSEPTNYRNLPGLYKLFAIYGRCAPKTQRRVFGAESLHRLLSVVTRALDRKDYSSVTVGDSQVFVQLTDPRSIVVPGEIQNSQEIAALSDYLSAGDTFVDVGANHGSFSVVASKLVGKSGLVVAVEPQPKLAALIDKTLAENDYSRYQVLNIACSDTSGTAEFFVPRASSGSAGLFQGFSGISAAERFQVRLERFDDCVDWRNFPGKLAVKLDVEGSEIRFLSGARQAITDKSPALIMEINPHSMQAASTTIEQFTNLLRKLGYEYWLEVGESERRRLGTLDARQRNIIVLPDR